MLKLWATLGLGFAGLAAACTPLSYAPGFSALRSPRPRPADTLAAVDRQAALSPGSRALYLKLIQDLRQQGKSRAALAHLDAFEKRFPGDPRARLLRAHCLVDVGELTAAEALYRRLLHGSESSDAFAGLGRIRALKDDWRGAVLQLHKAVTADPTSVRHLNDYGFALLKSGDPKTAVTKLRQAAELAPHDAQVRNNLALALASGGEAAAAAALAATIADGAERREVEAAIAAAARGVLPAPVNHTEPDTKPEATP